MNRKNFGANTNVLQIIIDIIFLCVAYVFSFIFYNGPVSDMLIKKSVAVLIVFTITFIVACKEAKLYDVTFFFYFDRHLKLITRSFGIAIVVSLMGMFFFLYPQDKMRHFYYIFLITSYVSLMIDVIASRLFQTALVNYKAPRAAFVGVFEDFEKFHYFLNKTSIRLEEIGYISMNGRVSKGVSNVLGNIEDIENIIRKHEIDQIYFFKYNDESNDVFQKYIDICLEMGITVRVVLESYKKEKMSSYVSSIGIYPMITYHTVALNSYEKLLKRLGDLLISAIALILVSPIMIITAAAIKLDSKGPVFFVQKRVGQNGRIFNIYKFRSMCADAELKKELLMESNEMSGSVMFKMKDDPRVTRVGRFIRRTSIDELPQLFNVIIGNMSLVGTRPPTIDEVEKYDRGQWRRISIKPGITGLWQVSGRSNIKDFDEVVKLDLRYIDNWSLMYDVKIMLKTILVLLGANNGAY